MPKKGYKQTEEHKENHRKFTDVQEIEIERQYREEKISYDTLAKRWNCSATAIATVIRKLGKSRTNWGVNRKFTKEQEKEICRQYIEEKLDTPMLANMWGCGKTTIGNILKRNDFSLRSISEVLKGHKAWNKNLTKETDERVRKASESQIGRKAWNKDIPCSEETKKKISKSLIGEKNPNFGKPKSEETKRKIGKGNKGKHRSDEMKEKLSISNTGKKLNPCSEKTKQKMREKALLRVQNQYGPFKDTKPELIMKKILTELNIPFEHQYRLGNHLFDFYLLNTKVLIEVDGDYWHGNPNKFSTLNEMQLRQQQKDIKHNEVVKINNYILLRFWEDDILNNTEEVKNKLKKIILNIN